jgi:hypothetical protein
MGLLAPIDRAKPLLLVRGYAAGGHHVLPTLRVAPRRNAP